MMEIPNKSIPLTIYKASAGSGKTFTLSVEYIKLLILQPYSYRSILAVTFTNKATEEMKHRILSQLYGLWKRLPESKNYMDKIVDELSVTEEYISRQSGTALHNILHDYSYFRIETIDTFFQSILRNLARELDLTANLRLELNDYQVEQTAVDELIEQLKSKDSVLQWIMSYIKENMAEDKNWNVIGQIKRFGENIFRDYYKSHSEALNTILQQPGFFDSFTNQMRLMMRQSLDEIRRISQSYFHQLETHGLNIEDFAYGKTGVCSYFIKLQRGEFDDSILTKRVLDAMSDASRWVKKSYADKDRADAIRELVDTRLLNMLNEAEKSRKQAWKTYKSAELTLRHMNQLRLLNSIENKVRSLNSESNRFLLSDTQTLLHALIKDTDTPFIFEKTGSQLEHVMIDEFQDTSTVQWINFKKLFDECISHSHSGNLIVGDVKQSIYRWRSGDWRLLNDITSQFPDSIDRLCVKTLDTNYRSLRNVVEFNNAFFRTAAHIEFEKLSSESDNAMYAEQLRRAYEDVVQSVPTNKKQEGLVLVKLLPNDNYQEQTLTYLKETIEDLLDKGIPQRKIAILVRSNATIQLVADYFTSSTQRIKIVSDEAFRLDKAMSVNIIVNALRLLTHPDDKVALAFLIKSYQKHILHNPSHDIDINVSDDYTHTALLPKEFSANRQSLLMLPLYDAVEKLYAIFRLDKLKDESAYICTFYDYLTDFIADTPADIDSFLDEWDSNISGKTIQANDVDGVRLITIHKSKGLEFDNVLMPFCDWRTDSSTTIWCTPNEPPFSILPVVPVDYSSKQMKGTIYENDYKDEYLQNTVDNLNLLYVAFTRASNNLFIFGRLGNRQTRSAIIEQSLPSIAEQLPDSVLEPAEDSQSDAMTFSYGELFIPVIQHTEVADNIFLKPSCKREIELTTYDSPADFRQSNQSLEFTKGDDDDKQADYIKQGSILHRLFSTIHTFDDMESAIQALDFEGLLNDCGMTVDRLRKFINDRLNTPQAAEWFSGKWQVFNECSILSYDPEHREAVKHRPDRVMTDGDNVIIVDFKFGHPRPEYHRQVKTYMTLVSEMGYHNVRGYLWFVYTNNIEEVK